MLLIGQKINFKKLLKCSFKILVCTIFDQVNITVAFLFYFIFYSLVGEGCWIDGF